MSTQTSSNESLGKPAGPVFRVAVILLMGIGSIAMWLGVPIGIIYGVSKMVSSTQPQLGPYLIILFGVPIGMTIIGKGLGALDRYYIRKTGGMQERYRAGWLKSMRGESKQKQQSQWKVLDVVMIASVSIAGAAMGIWFLFFAGSSI
ncbi:MAG: hypothetical protein QOG77_1806 [Solirubrobacteraceae bacterium]|jgi:hypothetical protein|nr:hypothetical protein [Solirubrobacteraceae bacterium]